MADSGTFTVGPASVTVDNIGDRIQNTIWNESTAFRNMPQSAKDEAKVYKAELSTAIQSKDPAAAKKALGKLATLYDEQSKLAGGNGTEQGRGLKQLADNCRTISKVLMVRAKYKEIEELPGESKIDCIRVAQ